MRIKLIAVGQKMPAWVDAGFHEYARRLPNECALQLIEIPFAGKRDKQADLAKLAAKEGVQMLKNVTDQDRCIALDVTGKAYKTEQLSTQLAQWQQDGRDIALLVGGPEGLAPECQQRANQHWSLSPLTLPHPLVRIVVAEQLYRAWSILVNHPYHRG